MILMMHAMALSFALTAAPVSAPQAKTQASSGDMSAPAQKAVRALVNAIRYNKDDMAVSKLNARAMAQILLGDTWSQATAAQQQDIVTSLTALLARTSFPKGRELFAYLDALLFEPAQQLGELTHLKTTVVVHRNLKKVELPIEWVLTCAPSGCQVVDIISMNESTAQGIRDEEVAPLLREGGLTKLIDTMHERLAKLPAAPAGNKKP